MTITKGQGELGRLYERLRKRSLRRKNSQGRFNVRTWAWSDGDTEHVYLDCDHAAYVQGLRDMAQAVQAEVLDEQDR